jgi:hypothetical protein
MRPHHAFAALLINLSFVFASAFAGQGVVEKNRLTSNAFPVGTIDVDPAFQYIGTTSFVLYGVADCEIHLFAELDGKQVKRFYWVQFEAYLPDNKHTYNYGKDPQNAKLGGHAFHERIWFRNRDEARKGMRPNSDSAAVVKLFEDKGYTMAPEMAQIRMVRLDQSNRKELMIIYAEPLPGDVTAAALAEGGSAFERRTALSDRLRANAVAGLKIDMP